MAHATPRQRIGLLPRIVALIARARGAVVCDRCHCVVEGARPPIPGHMTAGYYHDWPLFMDCGEHLVCDACAWADARYIAVYGTVSR
jgi:hypothetical protein